MRRAVTTLATAVSVALSSCESGGTSSREMEAAAIQRARDQLRVSASVPLQARVWVGSERFHDEVVLCGTVSDLPQQGRIRPQRFAATGDPINWLVFEDAHAPMIPSQPGKFQEWGRFCSAGDHIRVPTSETNSCGTRMDGNQNGKIEEVEYNSFGFAFDNWDTNDDYAVSNTEFERCWAKMGFGAPPSRGFGLFDADADGSVSQEEFFAPEHFEGFIHLSN